MRNKTENTKPWSHDWTKNQRSVPEGNQADFCFLTPQDSYHSSRNSYERISKKYKDPAFTFPTASSWCVLLSQSPLTPVIDYTATSPYPPASPPIPAAPQTHTGRAAGSCDCITSSSVLFAQCTQNKPKEFHNQLVFHMRKACFAWRDWSGPYIKFYTAVKVENMLKTCNKSFNRRTFKILQSFKEARKKDQLSIYNG